MEKSGVPQRTQSMRHDRSDWSAAITLLTAVLLVAATSLVWFSVRKSHDNHIMEQARSEIENFAARLDAHVKLRISLGALIGEEWRNGLISGFMRQQSSTILMIYKQSTGSIQRGLSGGLIRSKAMRPRLT